MAWTEADKPVKLAARSSMISGGPSIDNQPMFCYETMLNLLYWSCLVYDHDRARTYKVQQTSDMRPLHEGCKCFVHELQYMAATVPPELHPHPHHPPPPPPPPSPPPTCPFWLWTHDYLVQKHVLHDFPLQGKYSTQGSQVFPTTDVEQPQQAASGARTILTVETAMSLYGLTESESFWEVKQDTRCLVSWGGSHVVVAFRGTASVKNALADLQVDSSASCLLPSSAFARLQACTTREAGCQQLPQCSTHALCIAALHVQLGWRVGL